MYIYIYIYNIIIMYDAIRVTVLQQVYIEVLFTYLVESLNYRLKSIDYKGKIP